MSLLGTRFRPKTDATHTDTQRMPCVKLIFSMLWKWWIARYHFIVQSWCIIMYTISWTPIYIPLMGNITHMIVLTYAIHGRYKKNMCHVSLPMTDQLSKPYGDELRSMFGIGTQKSGCWKSFYVPYWIILAWSELCICRHWPRYYGNFNVLVKNWWYNLMSCTPLANVVRDKIKSIHFHEKQS